MDNRKRGKGSEDNNHFATFEQGHRIMQIVDAVMESNFTGSWIKITD